MSSSSHAVGLTYLEWNDRLAAHFFNPDQAGRHVYLYTTEQLIGKLGEPYGGVDDFIAKAKLGISWVANEKTLVQKALKLNYYWRSRKIVYPPYIGYLALFALAAGLAGDFATHSYYPRLRNLLAMEGQGAPLHFEKVVELWQDLEQWSQKDRGGELGVFSATATGAWRHVGMPISQELLSEEDRRILSDIFAQFGFDPAAPPSDQALTAALCAQQSRLRSRTLNLLKKDAAHPSRAALLNLVLDELQDWDGTVASLVPTYDVSSKRVHVALRLCCSYDPVNRRLQASLRGSTAHDLPEGGLSLSIEGRSDRLTCEESSMGWTEPLVCNDGHVMDAATLDWRNDIQMRDRARSWSFILPGAPVRVLVNGSPYGLPGLIEVQRLPVGEPFYLLAHEECGKALDKWGRVACDNFRLLSVQGGLPDSWNLYAVDASSSDALIKDLAPALSFPTTFRLDLVGGVRVERGATYFSFAPPRVVVRGPMGGVDMTCNDGLLVDGGDGVFTLPHVAGESATLVIAARRGDDEIARRTVYLLDAFPWQGTEETGNFDPFGDPFVAGANDAWAIGAFITGTNVPPTVFGVLDGLRHYKKITFIGRRPGQIALWPEEPAPTEWTPVWAITSKKSRLRAIFRETDMETAGPDMARRAGVDRKRMKKWKEVLWVDRMKFEPIHNPLLARLWRRYRDEAHAC